MPPVPHNSRRSRSVPRSGRKKALIIGIDYQDWTTPDGEEPEFARLYGPHKDATSFKQMLISKYHYKEKDITLMLDKKKGVHENLRPTYKNIMREVMNFTVCAEAGDTYVFYFCGHSGQIDTKNPSEDDGMDEVILPEDHEGLRKEKVIFDNDLRKYLVDPLPVGARLVAVFDSCHSGTLLDLDHYDCNVIYNPWVSKGQRRPRSLWAHTDRQNALLPSSRIFSASRTSQQRVATQSMDVTAPTSRSSRTRLRAKTVSLNSEKRTFERVASLNEVLEGLHLQGPSAVQPFMVSDIVREAESDPDLFDFPRCMSPISDRTCSGDCLESPTAKPDVVSLSACTDSQIAWESNASMTQVLIKVLDRTPCPTFQELLQQLGFQMHKLGMDLHEWSREQREEYKTRARGARNNAEGKENKPLSSSDAEDDSLELVNFQEPQLGSQKRLDMHSRFIL